MKKKLLFTSIEIIIWIAIVAFIGGQCASFINKDLSGGKNYQISFKDIDSLTVGSPVRIMGIQVGHVTQIKPQNDDVYVNFVITDKNLTIPDNSEISLEFTGIAGSKSIEIEPPKKYLNKKKSLKVSEPIRVNSLMDVQTEIASSILDFSYNILNMFGKGETEFVQKQLSMATSTSANCNKVANIKTEDLKTTKSLIKKNINVAQMVTDSAKKELSNINDKVLILSNKKIFKSKITKVNNNLQVISAELNPNIAQLKTKQVQDNICIVNNKIKNFDACSKSVEQFFSKTIDVTLNKMNEVLGITEKNTNKEQTEILYINTKKTKINAINLNKSI